MLIIPKKVKIKRMLKKTTLDKRNRFGVRTNIVTRYNKINVFAPSIYIIGMHMIRLRKKSFLFLRSKKLDENKDNSAKRPSEP